MRNEVLSMKREYGKEQPYIPCGIFKIRLPFVHFGISGPEVFVGLSNTIASLVAVATLMSVLGIDVATGRAVIVISSTCYLLNWFLGDPCIGGWITPALAIVTMYLTGFEIGTARFQAMAALQLEVAIIFLFLGVTGLAKKIVSFVPPAMKGGIIMGAAIAAVESGLKNYWPKGPVTVSVGIFVAFFLMYSARFKAWARMNSFVKELSKYTFPIAMVVAMVLGGVIGDVDYSGVSLFPLFELPDFVGAFRQMSPLFIGFPPPMAWIQALPTAIAVYIIAFGDFVTIQELVRDHERDDEVLDANVNRSSIICGIRNLIMGLLVPFPQLCGPVSAPYIVPTMSRYKEQGREGMDNLWAGIGTLTIVAVIFMLMPVSMALAAPASFCVMGILMLIQGYTCTQVGMKCCHDNMDIGITGMMTGVMCIKGGAWAMGAGLLFYLLLTTKEKIKNDHAINKKEQAEEEARLAGKIS